MAKAILSSCFDLKNTRETGVNNGVRFLSALVWPMTTVSLTISNSNDQPIYLQVDPWASLYLLRKGDRIEIISESDSNSPSISIQEYKNTRIIVIESSSEYFVVRNGERFHWKEYPADDID